MTLPPERIGDKGQRYEIRCEGYPEDGRNTIGWAPKLSGAVGIGGSILKAPGAVKVWVVDREDHYKVVWVDRPEFHDD